MQQVGHLHCVLFFLNDLYCTSSDFSDIVDMTVEYIDLSAFSLDCGSCYQ